MPIMGGLTATEQIRMLNDAGEKVPIIAMTANAIKGDMEKYLTAGMDDYLSKPVSSKMLRNILKKYIPN